MENLQRVREIHRVSFKRVYDVIIKSLQTPDPDLSSIHGNIRLLDQKMEVIADLNRKVLDLMLDGDSMEEIIDIEVEKADELISMYNTLKFKVEQSMSKDSIVNDPVPSVASHSIHSKSGLKLPRIEFVKFGGDIKDWLSFWSQFKRIDGDKSLDNEDKFQYLIQATIPNSRAHQLVRSYPPSGENYPKVIDSLKTRFGKDELLVEFYVRELLKLVMHNLNRKVCLSTLFDKLESQLRALETLGVTSEKYAAMLFPLVEFCLPEDVLRVWQRSTVVQYDSASTEVTFRSSESKTNCRLKKLMMFLRREVENEERISLAVSGFDNKMKKNELSKKESIATASALFNHKTRSIKCIFCRDNHPNNECDNARKMKVNEIKKILSDKGCCHLCMTFGHIARRCRVKIECTDCKKRHATMLCPEKESLFKNIPDDKQHPSDRENNTTTVDNLSNHTYGEVFLQTLVVELHNDTFSRRVRVIIDTGSQRSYINTFSAKEMEFPKISEESLVHTLFGGTQSEVVKHSCYKISLRNLNRKYACNFQALDQSVICSNVICVRDGPWINELQTLQVDISDVKDGPIEVLIGSDVAGKLFTGRNYRLKCGLVAVETLLGWTLMGKVWLPYSNLPDSASMLITTLLCKSYDIADLWKLDILGIADPKDKTSKKEAEASVMNHFQKTVSINEEGRYEVVLPWIDSHPPLPSNYDVAKRRLDNLMLKLKNDGYYGEYNKVFSEWLAEGVIEIVPESELMNKGHYLPHRHVVKLSSATTKLRPVFDASARVKNHPSLNQCLEKGINLIELIPMILIRFRFYKIGVISDIKKAFLQISLCSTDRDFLRFLWYEENGQLRHYRHTRVVFGVTCSPFHLGAVIQNHLAEALNEVQSDSSRYSVTVISKLSNSFYVDNCIVSLETEEELQTFIKQSQEIMSKRKFDLRGWEWTISDGNETYDTFVSPVLGLKWNRLQDTLELCLDWFQDISIEKITKRLILSVANKIFDPIGFSCPVSLIPKILLQKLWILKIGWDTEVPDEAKNQFLEWMKDLSFLVHLKIPRRMSNTSISDSWSIHMFSDASKDSYAAAVFLRSESDGETHVQLIQSKCRVSPVKKISIPRLELLAANIGARLTSTVLENFDDKNIPVFCWTDSSTVLSWIRRENQWKTFVWNRVQEIRSLTSIETWNFVPGHMNPADLPSRGCSPKQLLESKWWEGPFWLLQSKSEWPSQNFEVNEDSVMCERKKCLISSFLNAKEDNTWYYRYFSKYKQILNLIGWLKRFINNCRSSEKNKCSDLTLGEKQEAEKLLIKFIQREAFVGIHDDSLSSLLPYEDEDGLFKLKTKIVDRADLQSFRNPIILPSDHPVVARIIHDCHVENCHVGTQGLLSMMREKFWIIKGRKTIKSVISKCVVCRRNHAKNLDTPPVPLPENRIKDAAVFEIIGVDLAGPLFIKHNEKVWITIFTCAVYRAVHFEVVSTLSTDSFLQGFRKFISRRGRPSVVYSDNGKNFVGSENLFAKIDWNKVSQYGVEKRILWKFNPPTAAWWGGWWERLIRLMKQLLRKTLGRVSLTYEELSTVMCECEAVMNSRPLTYVSEDCQDLTPLTPSMFLQDIKQIGVSDIDEIDAECLNRHVRYRVKLKEDFRKRFRIEYLSQLIMRPKKCQSHDVKVGDVVLIGNDSSKRFDWPLGLVEEIFPGRDGRIRVVRLKTSSGYLMRPVQRLFPLEVSSEREVRQLRNDKTLKKPTDVSRNEITDNVMESNVDGNYVTTRYGRKIKPPSRLHL